MYFVTNDALFLIEPLHYFKENEALFLTKNCCIIVTEIYISSTFYMTKINFSSYSALFSQNLTRSYSFFVPLHTQNKGADRIVNKIT